MLNNPTYYALIEACRLPGCPVCRLGQQAVARYLDNLFYENVNDWGVRRHLRESLGFCREHTGHILEGAAGNGLGVALIYQDILKNLLDDLPYPEDHSSGLEKISAWWGGRPRQLVENLKNILANLTPTRPCPACQQLQETDRRTVGVLLAMLSEEPLQQAFQESQGLCLPHLRLTLNITSPPENQESVLALNGQKLAGLKAELAEYIRKNDHRFAHEGFGPEGDSWRRAMRLVVGEVGPAPKTDKGSQQESEG